MDGQWMGAMRLERSKELIWCALDRLELAVLLQQGAKALQALSLLSLLVHQHQSCSSTMFFEHSALT